MFAKILCLLLFACQVVVNQSVDTEKTPEPVSAEATRLSEGYVKFDKFESAFKIYQENSTWEEAKERCTNEGARLAVVDTTDKITQINSVKTTTDKWLHVGFHKPENKEEWVRADTDEAVDSIPWAEDNPDSAGECAGISLSEIGLVNYPCDWKDENFVCEIEL